MQIRVASQLCSRHVQRAGVTTQRGRSRARRFQKGGGASRPGPRPAADWWLAASQGAKSSSSGGPRAARPGRRPVPALLAPSSLSHAAARPSRHCPSHGPAGPLCREGHRSTASPAAERAPCCSARGEAPALPCPRHQPHPSSAMASRHGGTRGAGQTPTPIWAGACRGAAEPPPCPLTPHVGPLPSLCLPQPPDWGRLRSQGGPGGSPSPCGSDTREHEGQHQGSPGGGWQARPSGSGRTSSKAGESQQPAKPWSWQGRCPAAQTPLGGLGRQNLPLPAATGRGQGHACPPPAWDSSALLCPPQAGTKPGILRSPVFSVPPRPSPGKAEAGPSPHGLLGKGTPCHPGPGLQPPRSVLLRPQLFQPRPGHPQLTEDTGLSPGTRPGCGSEDHSCSQPGRQLPEPSREGPSVSPA